MKVGRAGRETAKDRSLDSTHVVEFAVDQGLLEVGGGSAGLSADLFQRLSCILSSAAGNSDRVRQYRTVVYQRIVEQLLRGVVRTRADERVDLGVINQGIGQCAVRVGDVVGRGMEVLPQVQWELMECGLVSRKGDQSGHESASAERVAVQLEVERSRVHARVAGCSDTTKGKAGVDGHANFVVGDAITQDDSPHVSGRLSISGSRQGTVDGEDTKAKAEARDPVVLTEVVLADENV